MYENFEEMKALADIARQRLGEGNEPNEDNEDMYADFRQYQDDPNEHEQEEQSYADVNEYTSQEGEYQDVDSDDFYKEVPYLQSQGDYEEPPQLDPYDEPLFPGGPLKSQIKSWKKEWKNYDIYVTEVLADKFVFRTLNRFEYKQLISLQDVDALQREEVICQTVTLWPKGYDWKKMATDKAGIPSTLSEIVMEKSGFTKDYAIQVL